MGGSDDQGTRKSKPLERSAESLGWLAQSSIQPRKRKEIDGVSANSMVDLKAQLYRTQEEARLRAEGVLDPKDKQSRRKAGVDVTLFTQKNAGVAARNQRDMEDLQRGKDRIGECYAALERKAKLYEQIVLGEAPDKEETYNVDFLQKHTLEDEAAMLQGGGYSLASALDEDSKEREHMNGDGDNDQAGGVRIVNSAEEIGLMNSRNERIQEMNELARETEAGRSKAEMLKHRRQQQQLHKRERLKQEYLKKQAARLKAAKVAGKP